MIKNLKNFGTIRARSMISVWYPNIVNSIIMATQNQTTATDADSTQSPGVATQTKTSATDVDATKSPTAPTLTSAITA